ncbi:mitochondrial export protein Som1 [Pyrenochaeta sp. MPI-SDFR-AT-0127]|nr:mitochondrial export protein Som1 [Pyrenochaeta sp. MPI-SDFR-AT-0127]
MPPPTRTVPLPGLESEINTHSNGKPRYPPIKLNDCTLKELVQYKCNVQSTKGKGKQPTVICEPVVRLLRRCGDGLNVETTAWEGWKMDSNR